MARKPKRVWWLIRRADLAGQPTEAVMDMLRYDGARVECNAPSGYYLLSSDYTSAPNVARWASFGIAIASLCSEYAAHDVARVLTPEHHLHTDGTHHRVPHSACTAAGRGGL